FFALYVIYKSYQKNFIKSYQLLMSILGLIGGIGINLMIFMSDQNDLAYVTYYSGLMLVYMAIYSAYRIRLYFIFMRNALYKSVWGNGCYTFKSN
ncbi:MAG: hypothetical protein ACKPGW_29135, partial [Microcystis panniformis]